MNRKISLIVGLLFATFLSNAQQRIVSLNGAVSEILCALGLESSIVGVDVTSNYPASLEKKARVGHNRTISAEGILALRPTLVLGIKDQIKPEVAEQLSAAHIKVQLLQQEYSVAGTRSLIQQVGSATGTTEKAKQIEADFNKQWQALRLAPVKKKVLFIYARGTGSMMVSGTGTPVEKMIKLAGAQNAVNGFTDFKPLSSESLVAANPDVILLFDSGLQSLGSVDGLLKVPGVAETNAGRNKKVITMDGQLLSGFGLRLPQAVSELNKKLNQ
ncbi:hemin ABC transporter substrate-binding protein [Niastella caeni]|uniref:Hemin ABC transporter substrate-binding protein n=1 Tax=Niastella caeni TaxID=2569763 RepID=A0A4S8HPB5_9BACT|nr:ABC transporter substrate-binding protein [Niastella caeni]THU37238.1 hemin ABC transporter substrate-binding protein [Niastella caeni]